ncbi:MAG: DNA polymerase III subunit beta, partial [Clostridia bacterium]|nr:DNA polymerase III subunit beta [Clostridia bacterium]
MRFSVNTKELNEAVAIVTKAMPAHSSLPILEGIYIYASASTLFLKCSD